MLQVLLVGTMNILHRVSVFKWNFPIIFPDSTTPVPKVGYIYLPVADPPVPDDVSAEGA